MAETEPVAAIRDELLAVAGHINSSRAVSEQARRSKPNWTFNWVAPQHARARIL